MNTGDTVMHIDSGSIGTISGHSDPSGYPLVDFGTGQPSKLPPYELVRVFEVRVGKPWADILFSGGAANSTTEARRILMENRVKATTLSEDKSRVTQGVAEPRVDVVPAPGLYVITLLNKKSHPTYFFAARIK
jgi:hypothetical protein